MSIRSLSALISASCVLLLVACGKKEEPPAADAGSTPPKVVYDTDAEKIVNVYNWSDYIDPKVLEQFEAETRADRLRVDMCMTPKCCRVVRPTRRVFRHVI